MTPQRIVVGVTGSIGAALSPAVVSAIRALWRAETRVVMTASAAQFVTPTALAVASGSPVLAGGAESGADGRVPHMELARWADLVLVVPATANTLAAVATGAAPNLLTTMILATRAPVVVVPSMNEAMWTKPAVQRNVRTLRGDGIGGIEPVRGHSAVDGQLVLGAMPPVPDVLAQVSSWLARTGGELAHAS